MFTFFILEKLGLKAWTESRIAVISNRCADLSQKKTFFERRKFDFARKNYTQLKKKSFACKVNALGGVEIKIDLSACPKRCDKNSSYVRLELILARTSNAFDMNFYQRRKEEY